MPDLSALTSRLSLPLGGRRGADVVGLDIQPGYVAAVRAHVNGGIVVERAASAPLPPDTVREGEVFDEQALGEVLDELFREAGLGRRVRVGLANQRTVLRTLELPPVSDRKELAAAVRFQAEDQVPMPLATAVLDFHSLGVFDTPGGPKQRVIVVAAQREMVERLLRAVRHAGLRPAGVDLSAFALIRSLYHQQGNGGLAHADAAASEGTGAEVSEGAEGAAPERVLYLNVGGLTNMAIAEGTLCRFTRVVGGGLEAMAVEIAERRGIPFVEARAQLAALDLEAPPASVAVEPPVAAEEHSAEPEAAVAHEPAAAEAGAAELDGDAVPVEAAVERLETWELAQGLTAKAPEPVQAQPATPAPGGDSEVRLVLENGIREIVGEIRNSLDFHRSQDGGGEVQSVVLSGPALELRGFPEALERDLGIAVRREAVRFADAGAARGVSPHRLAIATGLATEEAPR
jgi:type IV pilus assembly protein PilM